ncbi:hypothetical protein C8R47DRAFT_1324433 [Mycena vitilis]|nr:hypothetical protein C8R47DRAFT_1324433 [Mycena vitilis]
MSAPNRLSNPNALGFCRHTISPLCFCPAGGHSKQGGARRTQRLIRWVTATSASFIPAMQTDPVVNTKARGWRPSSFSPRISELLGWDIRLGHRDTCLNQTSVQIIKSLDLPPELWERILRYLDDLKHPMPLVVAAAVCTRFNHIASIIKLPVDFDVVSCFQLEPESLPFLQRSVWVPHITHLACTFKPTDNLLCGLRIILAIVDQSSKLAALDLEFPPGAFGEQADVVVSETLHSAFYDLLEAVSAKAGGQVLGFNSNRFSVCTPETLSCNYLAPRYHRRSMANAEFPRGPRRRLCDPDYCGIAHISFISSVKIRSHPGPSSEFYTVILARVARQFQVCIPMRIHFPSDEALDIILQHLTVRNLKFLSILQDITPEALPTLQHFLIRHPSLQEIYIHISHSVPSSPRGLEISAMLASIVDGLAIMPVLSVLKIDAPICPHERKELVHELRATLPGVEIVYI